MNRYLLTPSLRYCITEVPPVGLEPTRPPSPPVPNRMRLPVPPRGRLLRCGPDSNRRTSPLRTCPAHRLGTFALRPWPVGFSIPQRRYAQAEKETPTQAAPARPKARPTAYRGAMGRRGKDGAHQEASHQRLAERAIAKRALCRGEQFPRRHRAAVYPFGPHRQLSPWSFSKPPQCRFNRFGAGAGRWPRAIQRTVGKEHAQGPYARSTYFRRSIRF